MDFIRLFDPPGTCVATRMLEVDIFDVYQRYARGCMSL